MALILTLVVLAGLTAGAVWLNRHAHVVIGPGWQGVLYHNGVFRGQLPPGRHRIPFTGTVDLRRVWAGPVADYGQTVDVIAQDQFTFRLTLAAQLRVTDAAELTQTHDLRDEVVSHHLTALLIPHLRAAASRVIAGMTLDAALAGRDTLADQIADAMGQPVPGLELTGLMLLEITTPPEVRRMFTEVERARREGLAALERARAEQASLRALANAARALQSNPALAQLRMIQAAEGARGAKTFVLHAPGTGPDAGDPLS
ncbi:MAG: SPFH domain-containing protein [Paracoccus sp. (in: a-proteobacteria)]|uniref:SPFH domain-containing protein n=1 Tax=Paracoccus sp. TaxID=267 RepID=UPI0026E0CEC3|nr:SPFH domain-containing protein [Paracoccus sp. (in: a-proteobacteria)]MDO5632688.1 SPFH domain-containing protein [Paracoccus sp. (in: a-proteobacteria)]